jgi:hypothetical protein
MEGLEGLTFSWNHVLLQIRLHGIGLSGPVSARIRRPTSRQVLELQGNRMIRK